MTDEKTVQFGIARATLKDGVVLLEYERGAALTLAEAKADMAVLEELMGGVKTPIIVDLRSLKSVDGEARAYYSTESARITNAAAFLIGSAVSKVLGNFFIGLNKPPFPARLFTSEEEAVAWLKEQPR